MQFRPLHTMTPEEYYEFACQNPDLRIERTSTGEIVPLTPTGAGSGNRNSEINMQLRQWAKLKAEVRRSTLQPADIMSDE